MFTHVACSFLVALSSFAADAPAEKGPADLQGAWRLESLKIGGKDFDLGAARPRWAVQGTKVLYAGDEIASLDADPKATPKSVDLTLLDSKKTYEGIYSVDKDTLKIVLNAHSEGVKERPQDFSTEDKENLRLLVFRRDAEDKGDAKDGAPAFAGLMLRFDADDKEVVVQSTLEKSAAEKAGLRKDDVVLKVGDTDATDLLTTVNAVRRMKVGDELVFHLRRDGKEKDVTVKMGVMPFALLTQLE